MTGGGVGGAFLEAARTGPEARTASDKKRYINLGNIALPAFEKAAVEPIPQEGGPIDHLPDVGIV